MRLTGRQYAELNGMFSRKGTKRNPIKLKDWKWYLIGKVKQQIMRDFFECGTAIVNHQGNTIRRINPEKYRLVCPAADKNGNFNIVKINQRLDELQIAYLKLKTLIEKDGNNIS